MQPLVVAHRGASYALAEHTLGAYVRAIEEGAGGLECDVRLTRDGHLVCVHDRTVDRTSTGRGVVSDFDLDDLRGLDFGSWHAPEAGIYIEERDSTEAPVLTLHRLLEVVRDTGVRLLIETKHPTRYAGLVEQQLVKMLAEHGLGPDRVTVMSFSTVALRRIRLLAPDLPTVQLYRRVPVRRRDGSLPAVAAIAGPGIEVLRADPGYVARVHARGAPVYAWTVDEPADVELALALGVDALITNRPADVLARLRRG